MEASRTNISSDPPYEQPHALFLLKQNRKKHSASEHSVQNEPILFVAFVVLLKKTLKFLLTHTVQLYEGDKFKAVRSHSRPLLQGCPQSQR